LPGAKSFGFWRLAAAICRKYLIAGDLTVKNFILKDLAAKGCERLVAARSPFYPYFYCRKLEGVKVQKSLERNR
jgi:hypothetical protein